MKINAASATPVLGFGGASLGNLYRPMTEECAHQSVITALEEGITYFDTAPHYGLGLSERRLGEALRGRRRDEFVISTKVGRRLIPRANPRREEDTEGFAVPADSVRVWDPSESGIRKSLEESLTRLGLDHIDVLLLHDPEVYDLEAGITQAIPAMDRLRAEGLVKAIGVGSTSVASLIQCVQRAESAQTPLDVVMCAGRYTLLEQPAAEQLLPLCERHGVSVINAGAFNSGILAHDHVRAHSPYNYVAAPPEVIERAQALEECCAEFAVALPVAALHFAAGEAFGRQSPVGAVVVGAASPEEVRENATRMATPVPEELWRELARRGFIPA